MGKGRGMTTTKQKTTKRLVSVLAAALALFAFTERAEAQQILLTGPLAGAPAVRKLRLHRKGRLVHPLGRVPAHDFGGRQAQLPLHRLVGVWCLGRVRRGSPSDAPD